MCKVRGHPRLGYNAAQGGTQLFCVEAWTRFQDMRQNRFAIYSVLFILVIFAVMIFFRINDDKKMASVQAGALFVIVPLALLLYEIRFYRLEKSLWIFSVLQFWLLFALPIMGLRLLYWQEEFSNLNVLGVSGGLLHTWSSKSYLFMMIITGFEAVRFYRNQSEKNKKPV